MKKIILFLMLVLFVFLIFPRKIGDLTEVLKPDNISVFQQDLFVAEGFRWKSEASSNTDDYLYHFNFRSGEYVQGISPFQKSLRLYRLCFRSADIFSTGCRTNL